MGTRAPTIMLVEDDADIREVVAEILEGEGFNVCVAKNGGEALTMLESVRPGLILLDWSMPGMDGGTVLDRLNADASLSKISVVVLSGGKRHPSIDGRAGFLQKPVSLEALLALVRDYCPEPVRSTRCTHP